TCPMSVPSHRKFTLRLAILAAAGLCASAIHADEFRLKDGKTLHGVIVAYEDNMFKVKTDFGYVLVEKDKIASIIPDTPAAPDATKMEAAVKPSLAGDVKATPTAEQVKKEKAAAIVTSARARPEIPAAGRADANANAPVLKTAIAAPKSTLVTATPPPPPKEEPPANREEIQGNLYINHEFGFRMYKAPSWQTIDGAGQTLPNAIVAMGTANESTLLVIGHEKTKAPLETTAQAVENRLHDVYDNYRLISQRKTVVGGQPAVEYHYRGLAEGHDWSGTLSVVAHSGEFLTVLGMTFADTDLIQIQENVITRSIASLDFSVK
ncbi:MAG: hypothetical protein WBL63_22260, partial [Candidatus Acidiferrum sp.]